MAAERDFYDILGVDRNADADEIKAAFRRQALRNHPDRNPDDPQAERRFKEAAEAYEVLRNPETRQRYDRFGRAGLQGANVRGFSGFEDIFSAFSEIFGGGGGLFDDLFGLGGGRRRARRGPSLKCGLRIRFEEMARGAEKRIEIRKNEPCESCGGSGAAPGTERVSCPTCGGAGRVVQSQGFFSLQTPCPRCHGEGTLVENPCEACSGTGRQKRTQELTLPIPPGIEHGQTLVLRGEGEPGPPGGAPGDLHCVIAVEEHEFFERAGFDVVCEAPVPYATLVLGGEVEVPTLDGAIGLSVPRGTPSGTMLRVKGRGIRYQGGRGDQLVRVNVDVPRRTLSPRHEEVLRELASIEDTHVTSKRKSFFRKLKDMFTEQT